MAYDERSGRPVGYVPCCEADQQRWPLRSFVAMNHAMGSLTLLHCLAVVAAAAEPFDFVRDVQPILMNHCERCHGADRQESGLRVDSAVGLFEGGYSGPGIVAGQPDESIVWQAVAGTGEATPMPPEGDRLAAEQVALLRHWIEQGALAPRTETASSNERVASDHWSFQPVVRYGVPPVEHAAWVRSPIDAFVLARLEDQGIRPSPEADRPTLIRRLSLDLIGLPPTVEQVEAFLLDSRPDAYERLVDWLLASPHYGERWGRHWLDAARYADSNGYTIDAPRSIWKYRDWVIEALNRDLPFDQFTIEQLAGDLLPDGTLAQQVATGFHRNTLINQEGGTDPEQFRVEAVLDRVETTGTVFLGLTIGCAQCHDHKFDPISQRDFYRLYAFLNNADEPTIDVPTEEESQARDELNTAIEPLRKRVKQLEMELLAKQSSWEATLSEEARQALTTDVQAVLDVAEGERTEEQQKALRAAYLQQSTSRMELLHEIETLQKRMPNVATTLAMRERDEPRETFVMIRGEFLRPGVRVTPGVPAVLPPLPESDMPPNRLDLARWLVSPDNPLTARVTVNRYWQAFFGRGLVETENDFGTQGTPPSHPELLDWLASEFVERGWSTKQMHRLMVTSATYRQASYERPDLVEVDPRNLWLARQVRLRLEAEIVRDVALASSGLLWPRIGGPSVFPPQPGGVMELAQVKRDWNTSEGDDRYRRGMYTYFWRSTPHPFLKLFDAPDGNTACTRRARSNTPLQALTLLNDEAFYEAAEALARRVLDEAAANDVQRVRLAFRLCLAREPSAYEVRRLLEVVASGPGETPEDRLAAWTTVGRVLLNLDETVTRE